MKYPNDVSVKCWINYYYNNNAKFIFIWNVLLSSIYHLKYKIWKFIEFRNQSTLILLLHLSLISTTTKLLVFLKIVFLILSLFIYSPDYWTIVNNLTFNDIKIILNLKVKFIIPIFL